MFKKLIFTTLLSTFISQASAQPIKIQYQYEGQVFTGWLEYLNFDSGEQQIETGNGFGFAKEVEAYPADESNGHSFSMTASDVAFLFGSNWIGANTTLKYNAGLFESQTFKVKQIGLRQINGLPLFYFNLEKIID